MYANVVWGSACRNKLKSLRLTSTEKKIVRVLSFKGKYDHTRPLFDRNNMLTIDKINEYIMSLIYVFKKLLINSPIFQRYILGNSLSLVVPNITSNQSRQSVRWVSSQCWNSLPKKIRECNTLNTFKLSLKLHLLENDYAEWNDKDHMQMRCNGNNNHCAWTDRSVDVSLWRKLGNKWNYCVSFVMEGNIENVFLKYYYIK